MILNCNRGHSFTRKKLFMWKNYLLIAWRNLVRHPVYSLINILGLAIGMAVCFCMLAFAWHEASYEQQYSDYQRIYALKHGITSPGDTLPVVTGKIPDLLAQQAGNQFQVATLRPWDQEYDVGLKGQNYKERVAYLSENFFKIFTMPFLEGSAEDALSAPMSVVLSKRLSQKYFGAENALGKTLVLNNKHLVSVTGVVDFPITTHLPDQMFLSTNSFPTIDPRSAKLFERFGGARSTYLKLNEETNPTSVNTLLKELTPLPPGLPEDHPLKQQIPTLVPIEQIHLAMTHGDTSHTASTRTTQTLQIRNETILKGAIVLAVTILAIACLNFINLTTAGFSWRRKEIAIRKTNGATNPQLFGQYLTETVLLTLISALLAVEVLPILITQFGNLIGRNLSALNPTALLAVFFFSVLIGTAVSIYPAKVMISQSPTDNFHKNNNRQRNQTQKTLIGIQFGGATTLIIVALFSGIQLNHLHTFDHGLNTKNTLRIDLKTQDNSRSEALLSELTSHPDITNGARSQATIFLNSNISMTGNYARLANSETRIATNSNEPGAEAFNMLPLSPKFVDVTEIEMLTGRNFKESDLSIYDASSQTFKPAGGIILTEAGMKALGIESAQQAIGQPLIIEYNPSQQDLAILGEEAGNTQITGEFKIIGVSKNFNIGSAYSPNNPSAFFYSNLGGSLLVKISGKNYGEVIRHIQESVKKHFPDQQVAIINIQETYDRHNLMLTRIVNTFTSGALLAIVLAALGLYALSAISIIRRTKEVGVRKVLGSGRAKITSMLLWSQSRPILFALIFALPCGYLLTSRLLQYFPNPIPPSPLIFALAAAISICIAWITMATHALKVASSDPVLALRNE